MKIGVEHYKKHEGPGIGWRYYMSTIWMCEICVNDDGSFKSYVLKCKEKEYTGNKVKELYANLKSIIVDNGLTTKNKNSKDIALVYVNDLDLVKAFFPKTTITFGFKMCEYKDNIQFRNWNDLMPKGINLTSDDIFNTLLWWGKKFKEYGRTFLTLPQYPRKTMLQRGGASDLMPENVQRLDIIYKSIHSGLLYSDKTSVVDTPMIGVDLVSAYIHAIVYGKHCASQPIRTDVNKWEEYTYAEDKGCVGWYDLEYNCNHPAIRCYKDYFDEEPLQTGHHTVRISLCDIDLINLINFKEFKIIKITCKALYVYDVDYLPQYIRDYCIEQFIKKCTLPKDTLEYALQKTILNSGFFGNFLHETKQYIDGYYANTNTMRYFAFVKNASACPIWGIYTCAYVRKDMFNLAMQVEGWRYSDTDSVYCDDTPHNRALVNAFNERRWLDNMQLCNVLNYSDDVQKYVVTLGQFKPSEQITKFRFFNYKQYAYITTSGELTVKAAGATSKQTYDRTVLDDPEFRFKVDFTSKSVDTNYYKLTHILI